MLLVLLAAPCLSFALDESRLWLPKRYQTLYLKLVDAAVAAEGIDRCVTVLEGTIDLDASNVSHPIYRILCRQENGRSYNEMVDGITFETLTTPKIVEPELSEEELEAIRLAEEARKAALLEQRKRDFWALCHMEIQQRTRLMIDFTWVSEIPPEPTLLEEVEATFEVDFNAKNMWKKDLRYRAQCRVGDEIPVTVELHKRP